MTSALLALASLLYPFAAFLGLRYLSAWVVVAILFGLLLLRLVFGARQRFGGLLDVSLAFAGAGVLLLLGIDPNLAVRAYPVLVSAGLACLFGHSLLFPPTIIERLARLTEPDLPPEGVRYVRGVTILWLAFFLVNGAIAAWTVVYGTLEQWTLYNGLISYILIGCLFAGELIARRIHRRIHRPT